jgi:hypothetical protein
MRAESAGCRDDKRGRAETPEGEGQTMKSSSQTVIDHPVERVDLAHWISTLSDRDYQACSRAHLAAGVFREDGQLGMVNVESVGGNLLVQHYLASELTPGRVVMRSKKSRAYVSHLVPATIEVDWIMETRRKDDRSTLFVCTVETRMTSLLRILSTLSLLPLFLRRHTREETIGFAADISRKVSARGSP